METHVNYTIVGVFVLSLFAAIVLGIIWLSSGFNFEHYTTYKIVMQESVSGLSAESSVEFNGVAVGNITSMKISQKNPRLIEILISVKQSTPITNGTVATLAIRGITGIAYIALRDQGNDLSPLKIVDDESYPIIKTSPSLLVRMDTALTKLTESLEHLSHSVQALLSPENLNLFHKILNNTEIVTRDLAPLMRNSTRTLSNANSATLQINDTARSITDVSTEIKNDPSILIRGRTQQSLGPGEK